MRKTIATLTLVVGLGSCMGSGERAGSDAATASPMEHDGWESAYVTANDVRLHYWRTGGAGKPVMIFAHGITDFGLNWTALAERFEEEYDIILYDARGHGYSDKPDGPYDLSSHVGDLAALIEALQIEKPILVGHSMGGGVVALLAAERPDLPRALILEDPADLMWLFIVTTGDMIPNWKAMIERDKAMGAKRLIRSARTERHPGWRDADYDLWAASKLLVHPNVAEILDGSGFGNARVTYPQIAVPTLVLKADADEADRRLHRDVAALLPNGRLVHIGGAGHVIRMDRPEEVEREMRAFLTGLPRLE